jgi:hypothetical protein
MYLYNYLLWLKLVDDKAKQGREALTIEERSIAKATSDTEFNVPQPHRYLPTAGATL